MQTIITKRNGASSVVVASSWNGKARHTFDLALSSEANHRAAAEKLVAQLNAKRPGLIAWGIKCSAPMPGDGWAFMIEYVPDIAPMHMSIVVRFSPSTNTQPAHMKVSSWLNPRALRVNYANIDCGADIQGNARYAAELELQRINGSCREHGDKIGYALDQYVQLPDGDRLFTLKSGDAQ